MDRIRAEAPGGSARAPATGKAMPIFEYICKQCRHEFEALVRGADAVACPSCRSGELMRRLSLFSVGGRSAEAAAREPIGPCRTCGDPRGPGACALS